MYYALVFRDPDDEKNIICTYEVNQEGQTYLNSPKELENVIGFEESPTLQEVMFVEFEPYEFDRSLYKAQSSITLDFSNEYGHPAAHYFVQHAQAGTLQAAAADIFAGCMMLAERRILN